MEIYIKSWYDLKIKAKQIMTLNNIQYYGIDIIIYQRNNEMASFFTYF